MNFLERVAGAPISWGVCEVPGWGLELPVSRVLSEMRELGLRATELGPAYAEAWQELVKNNPFPAIHGRVCYHPCEDHCNRSDVDSTVSIHAVERFLGDLAV